MVGTGAGAAAVAGAAAALALLLSAPQQEKNWIQLFNGRDLTGWDVKISGYPLGENYENTFRVVDGLLTVSYEGYDGFDGRFGHLFYREPFSHYLLRVEYRFVDEQAPGGEDWAFRNSGVMLHAQSAESMGRDQDFPVSIEAQFLGGPRDGSGERTTANLCTPGTHVEMNGELITEHCVNARTETYHGDTWVTVEIEVRGGEVIRHRIDGEVVIEYGKPILGGEYLTDDFPLPEGTPLTEGYIALQAESHPIQFRKVELLDLSRSR